MSEVEIRQNHEAAPRGYLLQPAQKSIYLPVFQGRQKGPRKFASNSLLSAGSGYFDGPPSHLSVYMGTRL